MKCRPLPRENFVSPPSQPLQPSRSNSDKMPPTSFISKKAKILASLSISPEDYDDLSPKGSIDIGIRELIDEINAEEGWVTTSSCAGRVSVFLEGVKATDVNGKLVEGNEDEEVRETTAKAGGKGGGGRWLFVSHDPVFLDGNEDVVTKLGMVREDVQGKGRRFVRFKFEPMVCPPFDKMRFWY